MLLRGPAYARPRGVAPPLGPLLLHSSRPLDKEGKAIMKDDIQKRLKKELEDWRTRLGELRVQASLGKMELRDKKEELERAFERARSEAERKLGELKKTGGAELSAVTKSIEAGWDELRKTYAELRKGQK